MIARIENGHIIFDLDIQSPWDWIEMMRNCYGPVWYVGCYDGYENSLWSNM